MKHRMREKFGAAREVRRQRHRHAIRDILEGEISAERAPDGFDGRLRSRLVERDANGCVWPYGARLDQTQIDFVAHGSHRDLRLPAADGHGQRIEKHFVRGRKPQASQTRGKHRGPVPNGPGDLRQPVGPCHTAYMEAITASSTWAVQMFDVAFSRLICCSRVCSASRQAGAPRASMETPTSRPGSARL